MVLKQQMQSLLQPRNNVLPLAFLISFSYITGVAVSKRKAPSKQPARNTKKDTSSRSAKVSQSNKWSISSIANFLNARRATHSSERQSSAKPNKPQVVNMGDSVRYLPFFTALALVLVLLAVYAIGRANTSCAHVYSSNVGTIKVLSVMTPKNANPFTNLFSFLPYSPSIKNQSSLVRSSRAIIVDPQGNSLEVVTGNPSALSQYDNKNVILTGNISPCTKSITLDTLQNITPLFNANQ